MASARSISPILIIILFGALLRFSLLIDLYEWPDEIWSLWHVRGSVADAYSRTPYDWPAGYTLLTWLWMQIAGPTLEAHRTLTVCFGVVSLAAIYQAARSLFRLSGTQKPQDALAAVGVSLLLAVMGYAIFASIDVRAYGLLIMLGSLAFWLTTRWLIRATWQRALPLILVMALLFYASFTSMPFLLFLSVFVVIMRPRLVFSWAGIGLAVFVLSLAEMPRFLASAGGRIGNVMPQPLPPLPEALNTLYILFGGSQAFVLLFTAAVLILVVGFFRWPGQRRMIGLMLAWTAFPLVVYFGAGNNEFMKPRYMWWLTPGLALTIGFAIRSVPLKFSRLMIPSFALLALFPVDYPDYRMSDIVSPPFRMVFSWLARHMQPGDVLVVDPACACGERTGWDYFTPLYFPSGVLPVVDEPGDASRVWYLSSEVIGQTPELLAEVQQGRRASIFVGPWNFIARLYEGAPDRAGVLFGDRVRFHGARFTPDLSIAGSNDQFTMQLWWSTDAPLDVDYSTTIKVLDPRGRVVTQIDGPAADPETPAQTSAWQPGVVYRDTRTINLPEEMRSGKNYSVVVGVYQWWDGVDLMPEDSATWPRGGPTLQYVILRYLEMNVY